MQEPLQQVLDFAEAAHAGQTRKYTPERYMVHPIRVMEICSRYNNSVPVLAAALLHDVLEDTPVTSEELLRFLHTVMPPEDAETTIALVNDLTDEYTKERYPNWNRKKRKEEERERMRRISPYAQTIKYADILDNSHEITAADPQFAPRFLKECRMLLQAMPLGHAGLYHTVKERVHQCLQALPRRA
ncbi:HD domain-containing protein [Pseudocnuella soli]|uniref:HD domain-containing protein n=1 Tax=Pseudocnuella soli TaxID=2502779 RepID=UPI00104A592E|nr:HD domain-containing protein [Pseudocnuella soli]